LCDAEAMVFAMRDAKELAMAIEDAHDWPAAVEIIEADRRTLTTERDQLRTALAKAKEALKPFAVRAVFYDLERRKDAWPLDLEAGDHPGNLEVGDLRHAKATLAFLALLEAKAGGRRGVEAKKEALVEARARIRELTKNYGEDQYDGLMMGHSIIDKMLLELTGVLESAKAGGGEG
jgi:hypothetical protein